MLDESINFADLQNKIALQNSLDRIKTCIDLFGKDKVVLTTSFGINSAALLHMVYQYKPVKVIWVDTGYLFEETYLHADNLIKMLNLDVEVVQSEISPARHEALFGKQWEKGIEEIKKYNDIRKAQPLKMALSRLNVSCWISGVMKHQTSYRNNLNVLEKKKEFYKLNPILEWTNRDIYSYMKYYQLPYHPLFYQSYVTLGDKHSSRPVNVNDYIERDTRFGGYIQECGIHFIDSKEMDDD